MNLHSSLITGDTAAREIRKDFTNASGGTVLSQMSVWTANLDAPDLIAAGGMKRTLIGTAVPIVTNRESA